MSTSYASATPGQDRPTDLYRFYDSNDRLLYVGISFHAATRASEHRRDKAWWPQVSRMTVEHLTTRTAALAAEQAAIIRERPIHNVIHNGGANGRDSVQLTADMSTERNGIVGMFIHRNGWQGEITAEASSGVFLVQWYSWVNGYPTYATLETAAALALAKFYRTIEAWHEAGDRIMAINDAEVSR